MEVVTRLDIERRAEPGLLARIDELLEARPFDQLREDLPALGAVDRLHHRAERHERERRADEAGRDLAELGDALLERMPRLARRVVGDVLVREGDPRISDRG